MMAGPPHSMTRTMSSASLSVGRTVLVVDDDADMREVMASVLEDLGLGVMEAGDGL
jgi:CheY-like chemotaxis protein